MIFDIGDQDKNFQPFGRDVILRQIFDRICGNLTQGPQSCAVIAPPFLGKTTILHSIFDKNTYDHYEIDKERLGIVFINCGDGYLTRQDAFKSFGQALVRDLNSHKLVKCSDLIGKLSIADDLNQIKYLLDEIMGTLYRENYSVIFLLDEFELFLQLFAEDDIQFLRELLVKTQHAFVVAIPKPLNELTPKTFPSKFYLLFLYIFVKNFSDEQAREYITNRIYDVSDEDINIILTKCGRHPYFLNVYISKVLELAQLEIDWQKIDEKVEKNLREHFLKLWQNIPTELQQILSKLAYGDLNQSENLRSLQRLEDEFGAVYRTKFAGFELQGEIFKKFIISQVDIIAQFAKTDYYRAGVNALSQLQHEQYWGTDPIFYFRRAFLELSKGSPDYESIYENIRQTYEQLIDVLAKRSEPHIKRLFTGTEIREKFLFIHDALEFDDEILRFLNNYLDILNTKIPADSQTIQMYNATFRMYVLSAIIQLLVNLRFRYVVLSNRNAFEAEYDIVETIDDKGHSIVYKAKDKITHTRYVVAKSVNIKGLTNSEIITELKERLVREAQIIAPLNHPNIGRMYHLILEPLTLIMEWIEGDPLTVCIGENSKKKLDTSKILNIGIKLATVLAYVHSKGVIHRDLKPNNIILRQEDNPVLIDFDIAKASIDSDVAKAMNYSTVSRAQNGEHGYIGSPDYSSPEQWSSSKDVSSATDIFSLGVVLYELFTGARPFESNDARTHGGELPVPMQQPEIPEPVYTIICECLLKNPEQRPTAESLKLKLEHYQNQIGEEDVADPK